MPFFANIPAYRPPLALVTQPARTQQSLTELKIRVIEGVKTQIIVAGLLATNRVTVRDTGCGDFVSSGTLGRFVTNAFAVDKLMVQFQECAEVYEGTILQAMLHAGHTTDPDLVGTEIERIVRAYLEGGSGAITPVEQQTIAPLLDLALTSQVTPVTYTDALRLFFLGDKASADIYSNGTDGIRKKLLTGSPAAGTTGPNGMYRGAAIDYPGIKANPKLIFDLLDDLMRNCADELQDADDAGKVIYLTKSLYKAAKDAYRLFPNLESSKLAYEKGTDKISYDGVEIIQIKRYEQFMKSDFGAVAATGTPGQPGYVAASGPSAHLALYTVAQNMVMVTDLESDLTTASFFYEEKTRINFTRVLYRLGAGFAYDILVSYAV